ncbi:TIGR00180 family glycosyltransferase [Candidatus Synechococcus calcipolaris G9]|uniref:TIGR00180 family glycosyltransferase n=1 Tax=Candidatus Synechococcus calcipolaris G9 TaxID=1497997 RepID=A0ABT6EUM6_9SYNE|nr:TIGR00180 family glycosyltransferase [Candidatus Synechococcus calcipolaris]MDG2989565.1 TIGR00180 family glycosyltransferase [Candidatus Synechococcus calcipolaris G9]
MVKADKNLKKLTLVMLSYNRQLYALRNMRFWSGKEVFLHVIDGTSYPIDNNDLLIFSDNIFYHHIPLSCQERLGYAVQFLATDYVALIGDDEFFLETSLLASINELENDHTLVACMGLAIGFQYNSSDNSIIASSIYESLKDHSIQSEDPCQRMIDHMSQYICSTIYSVVRREVWIRAFQANINYEFPIFAIGELQFELSVVYFGKSKIIPYLHWLRSFENPSISNSEDISLSRNNQFHEWWLAPEKNDFREDFINHTLLPLLDAKTNENEKIKIKSAIKKAMDNYSNLCTNNLKKNNITNSSKSIFKSITPFKYLWGIMRKIKEKIYLIFDFNKFQKDKITLRKMCQQLSDQGIYVKIDEIDRVESSIRCFYEKSEK